MEFTRSKIIVRFRKDAWVEGQYRSEDWEREMAILPIAERLAQVIDEFMRQNYPHTGFTVRIKKGSHKVREIMRQDRW